MKSIAAVIMMSILDRDEEFANEVHVSAHGLYPAMSHRVARFDGCEAAAATTVYAPIEALIPFASL